MTQTVKRADGSGTKCGRNPRQKLKSNLFRLFGGEIDVDKNLKLTADWKRISRFQTVVRDEAN